MNIPDDILYAWAAGALDPGRSYDVEAALADPAVRQRVEVILAELAEKQVDAAPRWWIPPPGHPLGLRAQAQPVGAFSSGAVAPGDRVRLLLPPDAPQDGVVVVLGQVEGGWEVLFPQYALQQRSPAQLPATESGRRYLEVLAQPAPRRQRWAVVVAPPALIDWSAPDPWAKLQEAVGSGQAPAGAVEIEVEG